MAPDSKTEMGLPLSFGRWSTMAGIRLLGEIARNSGLNCSPLLILTGTIRYESSASSKKIVILCPLGVVQ
jgi:hypothetical protein